MSEPAKPRKPAVRLSRFEVVGAWLRIWTPPRGAVVPPVPTRRLAVAGVVLVVVGAVAAALVVPRIQATKRVTAERERAEAARDTATELARVRRDQRLHSAPLATRAGAAVVPGLEREIRRDARGRVAAGSLRGPVLRIDCRLYRPSPGSAPVPDGYACLAVTGEIAPSAHNRAGAVGYTFWARVDRPRHRYVWCKLTPRPAEGSITREAARSALPAPCDLTRPPPHG